MLAICLIISNKSVFILFLVSKKGIWRFYYYSRRWQVLKFGNTTHVLPQNCVQTDLPSIQDGCRC